jgi:Predicted Fe-S-cluster redox enzyme
LAAPFGADSAATGQMGMALNLTRDEILDQVIQANRELRAEGRSIRNVVFMGMGEPLLNEAEVYQALDVLAVAAMLRPVAREGSRLDRGHTRCHGPLRGALSPPGDGAQPAQREASAAGEPHPLGPTLSARIATQGHGT